MREEGLLKTGTLMMVQRGALMMVGQREPSYPRHHYPLPQPKTPPRQTRNILPNCGHGIIFNQNNTGSIIVRCWCQLAKKQVNYGMYT